MYGLGGCDRAPESQERGSVGVLRAVLLLGDIFFLAVFRILEADSSVCEINCSNYYCTIVMPQCGSLISELS